MVTQVIRNQFNEIQIGTFCQFGVRKKTDTGGSSGEIPPNEMYFTTTEGAIDYSGVVGDVITFSDGATYTVLEDGSFSSENVPAGKHKVKLVETREETYVGLGGEALIEIHNFPTLSSVDTFDTCPNNSSPNLVKVPTTLPPNITYIQYMFSGATSFNQDISMWDVSNVTDMSYMFDDEISFNQDISMWDVGKVTDMDSMFQGAIAFNQPLGNWNTSNVADMSWMFSDATSFNQDLSQWCVSNITQEPDSFADGSALIEGNFPVWGTCPA